MPEDGAASISAGFAAYIPGESDALFLCPTGPVAVTGIPGPLLAALVSLLARRVTRNQLYASVSRFPRPVVDRALEKLGDLGIVAWEPVPLSRAYHTVATRVPTPACNLPADALAAGALRDSRLSFPDNPAVRLPTCPSPRVEHLWTTISKRRSHRLFSSEPLELQDISDILTLAHGITDGRGGQPPLRAAPSGGALYPVELYLLALRVRDLSPGLYHHSPHSRCLELLKSGDLRSDVVEMIGADNIHPSVETCAAILLMTWRWHCSVWKYGERAYWLALIEAGHIGQNALLAATAIGIAAVPTAGLRAEAVDAFMELDKQNEQAFYAVILGKGDGA